MRTIKSDLMARGVGRGPACLGDYKGMLRAASGVIALRMY